MSSELLEEKIKVFEALDALNEVNDEDDHIDEKESEHRAKCRAFFSSMKTKSHSVQKHLTTSSSSTSRGHTLTAPTPKPKSKPKPKPMPKPIPKPKPAVARSPSHTGFVHATPAGQAQRSKKIAPDPTVVQDTPVPDSTRPAHPLLRRGATLPSVLAPASAGDKSPTPAMGTASNKRKRPPPPIRSVKNTPKPESDMIFRRLHFFYIPNDDIAPARKLRIARAQQHGAQWVRHAAEATHVIVDKRLTYKDVEPFISHVPLGSVTLVNEKWPVDCITSKTLFDEDQKKYQVDGAPHVSWSSRGLIPGSPLSETANPASSSATKDPKPSPAELGKDLQAQTKKPALRNGGKRSKQTPEPSLASQNTETAAKEPEVLSRSTNQKRPLEDSHKGKEPIAQPRTSSSAKDELTEVIELVQQYKDLPLEDKVDDDSISSTGSQDNTDSERESPQKKRRVVGTSTRLRSGRKEVSLEDRFACSRGGVRDKSAEEQNPNARTIEILQSMCDYYTKVNDHWRTTAYRKAITTLRRQTTKISTEDEAYRLPNIGRRLAQKIEEIVTTDRLKRLEYAQDEPRDKALQTFLKIYGVGASHANKWLNQGLRTLDDLRQKADLTVNQRIGIDHYDDLNTRIPRSEVAALGEYVKKEAAGIDPAVELLIGGSYRRGSESSGDIDFIVTRKDTTSADELVPFLDELVSVLTEKGFLVATLAASSSHRQGKDGPASKWHGCCVLPRSTDATTATTASPAVRRTRSSQRRRSKAAPPPPPPEEPATDDAQPKPIWRRIDFLLVPESEYGAALIYFTGNDIFNRSLRLLASKKGMRLNQRGLYRDVMRGPSRTKVTEGELIEGRDEKRIFEILGVKWREPWERWC